MKKYFKTTVVIIFLFVFLSSFEALVNSFQPPQGHTGADGVYCNQCHSTNPLNSAGGSVVVTGLPSTGFTGGTTYNFSLVTTHSQADRNRWGFSIEARNSLNQSVGTFSTTNANADINGSELSHKSAVVTSSQSAFTYTNLAWTAPANPSVNDQTITFYFVGNAANGVGSSGDFIYSGTKVINLQTPIYTFIGNGNWDNPANWSNNTLPPATLSGNASIIIEPPVGSECILNVVQRIQAGAVFTVKEGKAFRIIGDLIINK